jgi:hypothetical protein
LILLRENQLGDELVRVKASLEGCTKNKKKQLEELLQIDKGVFHETKGILSKMEVKHEIQWPPDSPLPNIGLYRQFILEHMK